MPAIDRTAREILNRWIWSGTRSPFDLTPAGSKLKQACAQHIPHRVLDTSGIGEAVDNLCTQRDDLAGKVNMHLVERITRANETRAYGRIGEQRARIAHRNFGRITV